MAHRAARDEGSQLRLDITAEDAALRIGFGADVGGGIVAERPGVGQPAGELALVVGRQRHARGRHVDAVGGIVAAIGEAAAEPRARLEHQDFGRDPGAGEVIGDRRAGKSAADDGDRRLAAPFA